MPPRRAPPPRAPPRLAPPPSAIRRVARPVPVTAAAATRSLFPQTVLDGELCFIIECPHCPDSRIAVSPREINCKIFRHGKFLATGRQIPPHTGKEECERLARDKLIDGCGRPFYFDGRKLDGTIGYI